MRLSVHVYNLPARDLVDLAVEAEARGLHGLWLGEHVVLPVAVRSAHPGRAAQGDTVHAPILDLDTLVHDPWVTMGAIAGATTSLELGLGVYVLPLRHPLLTARASASAFDFSGGRFSLGTGVGWLAEEFEALQVPFAARGARTDEIIEVLEKAWAGGPFEHHGPLFDIARLQVTPHPTPVPLIIGGNSSRGMARAVAVGDGWTASGTPTLTQACELRDELRRRLEEAEVTRPFRCIVRIAGLGSDLVEQYAEAGLDDLLFHVNQGIADLHGGWRGWLDAVSESIAVLEGEPVASSA